MKGIAYSCWNLNKLYAQIIFFLFTISRTTKHYRYMIVKCKPVEVWLMKVRVKTLITASWVSLRRVTVTLVHSPKPQGPGLLTRFHTVLWPQPGVCSPSGTTVEGPTSDISSKLEFPNKVQMTLFFKIIITIIINIISWKSLDTNITVWMKKYTYTRIVQSTNRNVKADKIKPS